MPEEEKAAEYKVEEPREAEAKAAEASDGADAEAAGAPRAAPKSAGEADAVVVVAGLADDVKLSRAAEVAAELCGAATEGAYAFEVLPMLEPDWELYLAERASALGGKCTTHTKSPLVLLRVGAATHYVGGGHELDAVCAEELGRPPAPPDARRLEKESHERYLRMLNDSGNQYVYLDVQFNANTQNNKPKKVVIELYNRVCPKTCFNFRALTTGELGTVSATKGGETKKLLLHYRGAPFHRVVPGGWVMSGDIFDGRGDSSVVDDFPDETFAVKFDRPGLVAMANSGAHTNSTQFFVTLAALDWLDKTAVAFGRVVKGMATIRQIGKLETKNERPVDECKIHNCGIINLKDGFGLGF